MKIIQMSCMDGRTDDNDTLTLVPEGNCVDEVIVLYPYKQGKSPIYSRILIILVFYMYYLPIFNNHIIATEYFEYEFKGYIRENIASSL